MTVVERSNTQSKQGKPMLTFHQRSIVSQIVTHTLLLMGVVAMFIPLAWTLSTSLKSPGEVYLFPPTWIPNEILWSNYAKAVTTIPFFRYLGNTTFITLVSIIGKVFSITLVAFAFLACAGGAAISSSF